MLKVQDYINEMENIPLFKGISNTELLTILACLNSYIKEYKKDEYVFLDNDEIKTIGVILSGRVQMIREDLWGNKAVIVNMSSSELFGETFACGSNASAKVSFVSVEKTIILLLPFNRVMHSCSMSCVFHHRLIENMVTLIADKNAMLLDKIDVMSKKSLREKISAYLTIQAEKSESKSFDIAMGRLELAEYLHADRSALSRELNAMSDDGLISFDKKSFQILKRLD
ncbi:MAG: Crp/Fnr family transcriptional regulator [Lachnospiraceae bacterium]|nr:Crp/Fnr family transcriptional regulator [Lachnospiraceae bacterium]